MAARESWALPVLSRGLLYVVQNTRDVFNGTNPRLLCYDLRGVSQMGLRPKPPASACGDPCAPRRSRRGAPCAPCGVRYGADSWPGFGRRLYFRMHQTACRPSRQPIFLPSAYVRAAYETPTS